MATHPIVQEFGQMAQWLTPTTDLSGEGCEFQRDSILGACFAFEKFAVSPRNGNLLLRVPLFEISAAERVAPGYVLFRKDEARGIVWLEYIGDRGNPHYQFWMNPSSLADLRAKILEAPEKRYSFSALATGEQEARW